MAELRQFAVPKYLYRYRSARNLRVLKREISSLKNGFLYASEYKNLNDPTEGIFRSKSNKASIEDILNEIGINNGMGVCSFSEVHNNHLMWAHYASEFSGFCVRYNLKKLLDALPDDVFITRINYDDYSIKIDSLKDPDARYKTLSRKQSVWSYEREWRIISNSCGRLKFKAGMKVVDRIFMGIRISDKCESELYRMCLGENIEIKSMRISGYKYQLLFNDFNGFEI